ncbi:hypothetical protein A2191_01150 [Candidatus Woesebacteria bacterium RIFOXYA1_FULL_38_9]|nr:MAG: hypothetical protein A2191_01150 [Candidatus Woesebacteria bacterium RIFOXYA1_FULL_38_9]
MKRSFTNKNGFTLVEVSIAGLLIVVLGISILGLQRVMGDVQLTAVDNIINVDESNYAISMITKEVRTARPADNGAFLLESATPQRFTFYSDIDSDNSSEKISYFLDAQSLKKSTIQPTGNPISYPEENAKITTITNYIRNNEQPVFYYYNENWPSDTTTNPLVSPVNVSQIQMIKIYLVVNNEEDTNQDYVLESFVHIRTIKNNL